MGRGKRPSGSSKKKKSKNRRNKAQEGKEASADEYPNADTSIIAHEHSELSETQPQAATQQRPAATPRPNRGRSQLEMLPPHLLFKIVNGLDARERNTLFCVVTKHDTNEYEQVSASATEETNDDNLNENDTHKDAHGKPPSGAWRVPMEFVTADPDTLLARLNTRRLYKRLKHKDQYTYPTNMTTDEIAELEWQNIVARATSQVRVVSDNTELPPLVAPSRELLMFTPCPRSVAVLASYPRSGNSLLRTLYEKITLRVSGSDMRGGLVSHDLVGEAAVSANRVQFVKTHYPERRGIKEFQASRVVLLVRNPYDALESYFNLMTTGTHTTSLNDEMRTRLNHVWESMVKKEIQVWQAFHEFWLAHDIPLLLVRYEDLIRYPYEVMCRVIKFVLEVSVSCFCCCYR